MRLQPLMIEEALLRCERPLDEGAHLLGHTDADRGFPGRPPDVGDVLLLDIFRAEVVRHDVGFHLQAVEPLHEARVGPHDLEREAAAGGRAFDPLVLLDAGESLCKARRLADD